MKAAKRFLSMLLTLCMLLSLLPSTVFAANSNVPFTDVKETDWFYDAVGYVYENGMMSGTGNNQFSPNVTTTRGMIVTILYRLEGSPAVSTASFDDVAAGEYYANGVSWAAANGVVSGYGNNLFGPNDPITREQMATILYRYAQYKEYETVVTGDVSSFTDGTSVSSYAVEPMNWAVGTGLLSGVGNNILNPTGNATRAEAATILMRFCEFDSTTSIETYTVTFDYNYGNKGTYKIVTVEAGNAVDKPVNPSRSGYSFAGWYTKAVGGKKFDFVVDIAEDTILYARWNYDGSSDNGYESVTPEVPSTETYTVDFVMSLDEQFIDNPTLYDDIKVSEGKTVSEPKIPTSKVANFEGWYTGLDMNEIYDFSNVITKDTRIFAKWSLITTDTDGDGIYDPIEKNIGTDVSNPDSDGDGLSDYHEVQIGTNPLVVDTDGDGTSDYDEDSDNDGLSNGEEVTKGTDPTNADSDYDGLNDAEELNMYGTNPLSEDTDLDGAKDMWEIVHGFDPLTYNASFSVQLDTEELSDSNTVAASVEIEADGNVLDTLLISKVETSDNPLVRQTIPGYMGSAYDFEINGSLTEAKITFIYDKEKFGSIGDDFQPRIYYINEETGTYDLLPNQDVTDGQVSVTVQHFSTYILLNSVAFEEIWNTEIKAPGTENEVAKNLTVAFVIDISGSMSGSKLETVKAVMNEFIDHLGPKDRAALVTFESGADLVQPLIDDKNTLKTAVQQLYASGGTTIKNGVALGIEQLVKDTVENSYDTVILLTDGQDSAFNSTWSQYAQECVDNNIIAYSIGIGTNVSSTHLTNFATTTGGKYYASELADDLATSFEEIKGETIDYTSDSNNDGISDYYTKLIYDGKLPMADHLSGIDFNINADYDGDGLKNGEEIIVYYHNGRTYLKMASNPILKHSDQDGIDDFLEVANGTNPLKYTVSKRPAETLTSDSYYYAPNVSDRYHAGGFNQFIVDANALIHIVWNRDELYRDAMSDYFANYAKEDYLNDVLFESTRSTMLNTLTTILGWFDGVKQHGTQYYEYYNNVLQLIDLVNGTTDKADLILLYTRYEEVIEQISVIFPDRSILVQTKAIATTKITSVNLTKLGKTAGNVCTGISIVVGVNDVLNTIKSFSAVSANNVAFEQNLDLLNNIIDYSVDKNARSAAYDIRNRLENGYTEEIKAIVFDISETAIPMIAEAIMMHNPYTAAVVVVRNGLDIITGISEDLRQQFEMFSYTEMARAASNLFKASVTSYTSYYEAKAVGTDASESLNRYLTHVAQARVLGEKKYCDWQEDGGIIGWFTDNSDVEDAVDAAVDRIIQRANQLNLTLHPKILAMGG